ncbi:MAG: lytic transglycosylase domain-containing protein [Actinobacteria bacterium]|nr:lytic transglycosylase domain-containing protein [Actinomycetota bacterium]MCL6094275.1 lytic transglycosylase domain-containing protein [Actinomycetota bacterium]
MIKIAMALLLGICLSVLVGACSVLLLPSIGGQGGIGGDGSVMTINAEAISVKMLSLYHAAAKTCPGLSWSILAAIGSIESDNGMSSLPGVNSGSNYMGAEGPMQFEPATFLAYATVGPGGAVPPNPYNPVDAVYTAATMLCANGASNPSGLEAAVYDYNHSLRYVEQVLAIAKQYRRSMGATR